MSNAARNCIDILSNNQFQLLHFVCISVSHIHFVKSIMYVYFNLILLISGNLNFNNIMALLVTISLHFLNIIMGFVV